MAIDLNELMEKFLETVGTLADKGAVVARDIGARSTNLAKKTKLTAEIAAGKAGLGKVYEELGKKYFEKYGEDYDTDFTETVMKLKTAVADIEAKTAELETLKAAKEEEDVEVEVIIEEAASEDTAEPEAEGEEKECCKCACDEEEKKVKDLGEKAGEIKDAVVQKAGELKDIAVQKFGEAKTATKDFIDKVNANEKVQEVKGATKEFVGKVVDTVSKKADEVVTAFKAKTEETPEETVEVVEEVVEEVKDEAAEAAETVEKTAEEIKEEIKEETEE